MRRLAQLTALPTYCRTIHAPGPEKSFGRDHGQKRSVKIIEEFRDLSSSSRSWRGQLNVMAREREELPPLPFSRQSTDQGRDVNHPGLCRRSSADRHGE